MEKQTPIPFFFVGFGIMLLLVTAFNTINDTKSKQEYHKSDVKTIYDTRNYNDSIIIDTI